MKTYTRFSILLCTLVFSMVTGCKKDFFDRPPQSAITLDNFYKTADQVRASTNILYSAAWFGWVTKGGWAITEMASGNGRSYSSDVANFGNFSVTDGNTELANAYNSLWIVVAQANGIINNLPAKVPETVDKAVVNHAIGEARLFRALAYFHLVRLFGNVPVIENTLDYVDNVQVNTNPVADVYKFILNDLTYAEANLAPQIRNGNSVAQGRVSSGSASALMAKVYLYMQDYAKARSYAEKVINSGEFKLYGADIAGKNFSDLFLTANNNNEESVIALQWAGAGGYGKGNPLQASWAANTTITGTGDGYGVLGVTFDLLYAFQPDDKRFKPTIMVTGAVYPEINQAKGGYTHAANQGQGTSAFVKKYVVGTPADNGGIGSAQSSNNNTYMMRYAEVYLILAEAIVGGATTSADPVALNAINKIRNRAGLGNLAEIKRGYYTPNNTPGKPGNAPAQFYRDDILEERRREFAFEFDYWFDLCRLDGFNTLSHPKATMIINQQDRGAGDNSTPSNSYGNGYVTMTDSRFLFPYPATEVAANPKLIQPPVPYVFK
ncbi:RagB/SusD family nutrient uptake outer membrane protein [Pedobacter sp. MR2016-24]|uniref:RagB/SusD family nutrient uptake outer membrane protein n=1 Tax=Pedobacter sp. MR2016-24 TaxID=2994466 RepID=UPI0022480FBA|nr:RagB/SusD family nutrient uptake outer membrane protein [Pedobacter sp. MR2016-24]MCX2483555.1 RagB/SusD family nutrient uptake outer membrane protein [Pedobacter sp. MR2016-24]